MSLTTRCARSSCSGVTTGVSRGSSWPATRSMIRSSSSREGYPTLTLSMKRSTCASGSGYVPSCSIGFSVASTRKGVGSGKV